MPWGALLLLGSGFAIADAAVYSGLSDELGIGLVHVGENLSHNVLLLIVIILSTTVTEICSNVASSIILIPIIVSLVSNSNFKSQ
jgi:sodium-dependent dicarboxylate transporter 2/3/5